MGLGQHGVIFSFESRWWNVVIEVMSRVGGEKQKVVVLKTVFRQKDMRLQRLLREVRYVANWGPIELLGPCFATVRPRHRVDGVARLGTGHRTAEPRRRVRRGISRGEHQVRFRRGFDRQALRAEQRREPLQPAEAGRVGLACS